MAYEQSKFCFRIDEIQRGNLFASSSRELQCVRTIFIRGRMRQEDKSICEESHDEKHQIQTHNEVKHSLGKRSHSVSHRKNAQSWQICDPKYDSKSAEGGNPAWNAIPGSAWKSVGIPRSARDELKTGRMPKAAKFAIQSTLSRLAEGGVTPGGTQFVRVHGSP